VNALRALGLEGRRALILHHDDLGLTHAQNQAYLALGWPTGSVILPAAWASGVRREDLGVHLVLTSEWEAPRYRPLTPGKSLRDEAGFFPKSPEEVWKKTRQSQASSTLRPLAWRGSRSSGRALRSVMRRWAASRGAIRAAATCMSLEWSART